MTDLGAPMAMAENANTVDQRNSTDNPSHLNSLQALHVKVLLQALCYVSRDLPLPQSIWDTVSFISQKPSLGDADDKAAAVPSVVAEPEAEAARIVVGASLRPCLAATGQTSDDDDAGVAQSPIAREAADALVPQSPSLGASDDIVIAPVAATDDAKDNDAQVVRAASAISQGTSLGSTLNKAEDAALVVASKTEANTANVKAASTLESQPLPSSSNSQISSVDTSQLQERSFSVQRLSSKDPLVGGNLNSKNGLDLLLLGIVALHVFMAPYTKVEESFNIQAMHDLLYHRGTLDKYDHLEFPGVVPRTFIGAIIVSLLSSPFVLVATMWNLPKIMSLVIVRLVLGGLLLTTFYVLRSQIHKRFGQHVSLAYMVLTILQFHLPFYVTRPLPNIFALAVVNLAYACWLAGRTQTTLACLVFAAVVFRCDVILLLGPIGLSFLWRREIQILSSLKWCSMVLVLSIGLTVAVDSVVWRRWLWPEAEVFWFNSVLNRSSEWGVSPVHWYFTSALPRAMLAAYPLCFLGLMLDRRIAPYVLPVLAFVFLYSKLAHKELRFIFFALPILNLSAAVALARIYNNRRKPLWGVMFFGCVLMLLASMGIVGVLSGASYANYPGGEALAILHEMDNSVAEAPRTVHIDVLPAMTGVSRFCEREPPWSYSKNEDLSVKDLYVQNFTYLLSAQPNVDGFNCLMSVEGFSKIELRFRPPGVLVMYPLVFIHGENWRSSIDTQHWPGCAKKM